MTRKAFVLIGSVALVIASAVPAQARPAPPTPERGPRITPARPPAPTPERKPRCSVVAEIPQKTKVRTCPDGQLAVYSWDSRYGWVLVYARLGER